MRRKCANFFFTISLFNNKMGFLCISLCLDLIALLSLLISCISIFEFASGQPTCNPLYYDTYFVKQESFPHPPPYQPVAITSDFFSTGVCEDGIVSYVYEQVRGEDDQLL